MIARAGLAQRAQGGIEGARDGGLDVVEHHGLRHRQAQPSSGNGGRSRDRFAGENRVEHRAACDRRRQRADRIERGRERERACVGTRCAVGLNPTMPQSAAGMRHGAAGVGAERAERHAVGTETAAPEDEPPGMRPALRS